MGRHDWYRTPGWSPEDQADFEARLRRARAWSRPQYLRIKGLALQEAGLDDAAKQLWLRTIAEYPEDSEVLPVREHLGDLAVRRGHLDEAEGLYRKVLTDRPDGSGTSGLVFLSLAELLTATRRPKEALLLLDTADKETLTMFTSSLFRWYCAHANATHAIGDYETAAAEAAHALSLTAHPSQYHSHPGLGVVERDEMLIMHLQRLAGDSPTC